MKLGVHVGYWGMGLTREDQLAIVFPVKGNDTVEPGMYDHGAGVELTGNIVGNIRRLRAVESPQLGNHRDVLVYLPPSYPVSGRHYPTIYMHDGQNLFDARDVVRR